MIVARTPDSTRAEWNLRKQGKPEHVHIDSVGISPGCSNERSGTSLAIRGPRTSYKDRGTDESVGKVPVSLVAVWFAS